MEIITWIGNHLPQLLKFFGLLCTFIAGCYGVWKVTYKPCKYIYTLVKRLMYEFSDNGGGSMKDKLNKGVALVEAMSGDIKYLKGRQITLLDELPYPFFENDANGVCIFVNKAWLDLTGLTFDLAIGHGYEKIIFRDDLQRLKQEGRDFIADGNDYESTFRISHYRTHEVFEVKCTASKITDDSGKLLGIIGKLHKV